MCIPKQTSSRVWTVLWKNWGRTLNTKEDNVIEGSGTRKPKESTNLGPWGLTEIEPPMKEHKWGTHRHPPHKEQMCSLVFMWVL